MIVISGEPFHPPAGWVLDEVEQKILEYLQQDAVSHSYNSYEELQFDLRYRRHAIEAAEALQKSGASFEIFADTYADPNYWNVTSAGGLRLRYGTSPAEALQDIYRNGSAYGFECATAMIIVFYYAALQTIGQTAFNRLFPNLYLYSWHMDTDLGLQSIQTDFYIPGDVVYFNNPDFHSDSPQWQGENAVVLMNDLFFGHGIGITTANEMIRVLNELRQPGSDQSAYITNVVTRADTRRLYRRSQTTVRNNSWIQKPSVIVIQHNETSISYKRYQDYLY
ncbi:protein-glutamine gamma-glutamyltransferase [Salibacterium qingdaonense]|uniref:Protein-glutamine gamma-glutamyltransferase n=1 Tax=Salibacterium qingdaonense TaxID=266892 RepID=A0A1I4K3X7_9BACI|nr:protein-glutamine gamma-glutamyltransferase [Salibacterium qingdaonense]SFL73500.1 protein-glutamine gamma-glutamyltransferase [Salibacterium qingdaonense]